MRWSGLVLVVLATVVAGCGGDGAQGPGASTVTASPRSASELCERSADRIRQAHPGAHVGECNAGTGTLSVPAD